MSIRPPAIFTRPFALDTLEHELLRSSIQKHGLLCPIVVADGVIVDGYRRWLTLRALGWADIPTVTVEGDPRILRVIAQSNSLSDSERAAVLSRDLSDDPTLGVGNLAHRYQWPPIDVERLVGTEYLSPRAVAAYQAELIPLAAVWHLGKLPHAKQDELLDADDILCEAASAARESREERRRRIVTRPRGKSIQAVLREIEKPTVAGPQLIRSGAKTAFDGWTAALKWVAGLDSGDSAG